jgi:asparagine synthase (glutamine-hydrolysing)
MCGIAGYLRLDRLSPPDQALVERMIGRLAHRGPDEYGVYLDERAGLGSARLSIIDLEGGTQPIPNETGTVWVVLNGEIYNHASLRTELEGRGHRFATRSDTEVIVHLYEEEGPSCVERLNGQFAFAIWDRRSPDAPTLVLARDRVGIRPLFVTVVDGTLLFGSEIKSLFADASVSRRLDPVALSQVFTLWTTLGERTPFVGVSQIPPGHVATVRHGEVTVTRYWEPDFEPESPPRAVDDYAGELRELLEDATRLRLNADVPVGSYLSGGLDSSTITRLAQRSIGPRLRTFSIAFEQPDFDERRFQEDVVDALGTDHSRVECHDCDIARIFPDVVWHAEWPVLRTAPAPMCMLSQLVHEHGVKVVLTGEGADEVFAGYAIFKEDRVRRYWARDPASARRPALLRTLYPYVSGLDRHPALLTAFFGKHLTETDRPDYSHVIRWSNNAHLRHLFAGDLQAELGSYDPVAEVVDHLEAHPRFRHWTPLARAQYIEMTIFMSGYLLSSQGDRMLMAHSVEGRFPFLDHRVIELGGRLPDHAKLGGLNEKLVVKRAMRGLLPDGVAERAKQPFRAPIQSGFTSPDAPPYVAELLDERAVERIGLFDPNAIAVLARRLRHLPTLGERDSMALAGVLSTMLLHERFVAVSPSTSDPRVPLARRVIGGNVHA